MTSNSQVVACNKLSVLLEICQKCSRGRRKYSKIEYGHRYDVSLSSEVKWQGQNIKIV